MSSTLDIGQRIRDDIVAGGLQFGERLTIDALASRYGVSHMPVREALRALHGEGLVQIEPNRGARVRSIDLGFVENLFEIRTALEVMMVRRAATRCEPRDIEDLQAIEDTLEQHIAAADHVRVVAQNHRFHQAINRCAANVDALPIIDKHWTLLAALWRHYGNGPDRFTGVANDHRHLINALAAHDQEAAAVIMGAHATKAKLTMLARIQTQTAPAPRHSQGRPKNDGTPSGLSPAAPGLPAQTGTGRRVLASGERHDPEPRAGLGAISNSSRKRA